MEKFNPIWTNLNGGELERIKKRELKWKNLIQSRTNLNGGELERMKAKEKAEAYAPL